MFSGFFSLSYKYPLAGELILSKKKAINKNQNTHTPIHTYVCIYTYGGLPIQPSTVPPEYSTVFAKKGYTPTPKKKGKKYAPQICFGVPFYIQRT